MIFAASATQNVGITIAVVAVAGWLLFVLFNSGSARKEVGSEIELAPNRKPYFDDDELETSRLDRSLAMGLGALIIVGVGLPLYWLTEPGRQSGATDNFNATFESRGRITYLSSENGPNSFGCQDCHGPEGVGGVAPFTYTDPVSGEISTVQWQAPALDTVLLRFTPEEVADILTFGRAGTPMPAWGAAGGGPMNDQQINDLVLYLASIQLEPDEAQAQAAEDALAAVGAGRFDTLGAALFGLNCARCHTQGAGFGQPGVQGGGAFGPSLRDGVTIRQFPDVARHISFIGSGSDANQSYGVRGIGSGRMPGFGEMLTEAQISAIVEYERSLGLTAEERAQLEETGGQTEATSADESSGDSADDSEATTDDESGASSAGEQ